MRSTCSSEHHCPPAHLFHCRCMSCFSTAPATLAIRRFFRLDLQALDRTRDADFPHRRFSYVGHDHAVRPEMSEPLLPRRYQRGQNTTRTVQEAPGRRQRGSATEVRRGQGHGGGGADARSVPTRTVRLTTFSRTRRFGVSSTCCSSASPTAILAVQTVLAVTDRHRFQLCGPISISTSFGLQDTRPRGGRVKHSERRLGRAALELTYCHQRR